MIEIPNHDPTFVPFGHYEMILKIIRSGDFLPTYVPGPTGCGKTVAVVQACAAARKPALRVNFTIETDRDMLIGGWRLTDGKTVFVEGPVIKAMREGCVLIMDEIDLAHPAKVLCLQPILEGSPYYINEIDEIVHPQPGFQIIATANTKGRGSTNGQYIGAQLHNEAFLERFAVTIESNFPPATVEMTILERLVKQLRVSLSPTDLYAIVEWASRIRKVVVDQNGEGANMSTRRLCMIIKIMAATGVQIDDAVLMAIERFEPHERKNMLDVLKKLLTSQENNARGAFYSAEFDTMMVRKDDGTTEEMKPF